MSEVIVIATLKAQPGQEDAVKAALIELVEATHSDDGCLVYCLHQGQDDATRLTMLERWASRETLEAHMATDHIAAAFATAGKLLTEPPDITWFDAVPAGDPQRGTIAAAMG